MPLDLRVAAARQSGAVRGSPVTAGNLFFACENPLSSNEITATEVRCRLPRKMVIKAGQTCRCQSVIGVAPPGQMRRAFLRYIERDAPALSALPALQLLVRYRLGQSQVQRSKSLDAIDRSAANWSNGGE